MAATSGFYICLINGEKKEIPVIKDCNCKGTPPPPPPPCERSSRFEFFEVDVGTCEGKCDQQQNFASCTAGVQDNFAATADPAPAYQASIAAIYPNCVNRPMLFDATTRDRMLCHTFAKCFDNPCPIIKGTLDFCVKSTWGDAFNDNIILNYAGLPIEHAISFASLNGGTWPSSTPKCFTIDLSTIPGFLAGIDSVSHMDVVVRKTNYEKIEEKRKS